MIDFFFIFFLNLTIYSRLCHHMACFVHPTVQNPPKYYVFIYKQQKQQILTFEYIFFLAFLPKKKKKLCRMFCMKILIMQMM